MILLELTSNNFMICKDPFYGLRLGAINPATGKERIAILPKRNGDDYFSLCERHGKDSIVIIPCGKCSGCIESRSKSWALRCVLEASEYENNCFLTLTYNDKCLPDGLCKKDLQAFIKRLRRKFPSIRYFACGEYGENTHRPHYHLIVFNFWPDDAKFSTAARYGGNFYTSKIVQELWPFGFVSVGECSFASCAYVARYCMKKAGKKTGEFSLMSLKPGIGYSYFEKNKDKIYKYDLIFGDFGSSHQLKPARYFDKLLERVDPGEFERIKSSRIDTASAQVISEIVDHGFQYYEQLMDYKSTIKDEKFKALKRKGV